MSKVMVRSACTGAVLALILSGSVQPIYAGASDEAEALLNAANNAETAFQAAEQGALQSQEEGQAGQPITAMTNALKASKAFLRAADNAESFPWATSQAHELVLNMAASATKAVASAKQAMNIMKTELGQGRSLDEVSAYENAQQAENEALGYANSLKQIEGSPTGLSPGGSTPNASLIGGLDGTELIGLGALGVGLGVGIALSVNSNPGATTSTPTTTGTTSTSTSTTSTSTTGT
jgi:hypothetical protein